jgi:hypothetical protein
LYIFRKNSFFLNKTILTNRIYYISCDLIGALNIFMKKSKVKKREVKVDFCFVHDSRF